MTDDAFHQSPSWDKIFDLYRSRAAKADKIIFRAKAMAEDMNVSATVVNQWRRNESIPYWYWARLITILERKFGLIVSASQLAQATDASRCRKREEAA